VCFGPSLNVVATIIIKLFLAKYMKMDQKMILNFKEQSKILTKGSHLHFLSMKMKFCNFKITCLCPKHVGIRKKAKVSLTIQFTQEEPRYIKF